MMASKVVLIWWATWLIIANLSITGLDIPSLNSQVYIISFLFSFYIGTITTLKESFCSPQLKIFDSNGMLDKSDFFYLKLTRFLGFFLLPIVAIVSTYAIVKMINYGFEGYRVNIFRSANDGGGIFNSDLINFLYQMICKPLISVYTILSIWAFIRFNDAKYLVSGFMIGALDSITYLGRFFFYEFIFLLWLVFIVFEKPILAKIARGHLEAKIFSKIKYLILFSTLAIFLLMVLRGEDYLSLIEIFKINVIDYHTIGFLFFDRELNDIFSLSNSNIYFGSMTFGMLTRYFEVLFHQIIPGHQYPLIYDLLAYRQDFISLSSGGINPNYYNAYYTVLTTLYMDGRIFGVLLVGWALGFSLRYNYHELIFRAEPYNFFIILLITKCMFFSIFQSRIEELILLAFIFFLFKLSRNFNFIIAH